MKIRVIKYWGPGDLAWNPPVLGARARAGWLWAARRQPLVRMLAPYQLIYYYAGCAGLSPPPSSSPGPGRAIGNPTDCRVYAVTPGTDRTLWTYRMDALDVQIVRTGRTERTHWTYRWDAMDVQIGRTECTGRPFYLHFWTQVDVFRTRSTTKTPVGHIVNAYLLSNGHMADTLQHLDTLWMH